MKQETILYARAKLAAALPSTTEILRGSGQINADELDSLTERVLGAVFEVTNTLGAGFLEKAYQRALLRESRPSRHPG